MERPAWAPQGIDYPAPSVSRIHVHCLGGSHNVEVGREAGRRPVAQYRDALAPGCQSDPVAFSGSAGVGHKA
jgi:hypothetical protein